MPQFPPAAVATVAALVAALAAAAGGVLVRGSTAVPAAAWAVAACLAVALEMALRSAGLLVDPGTQAAARLVAAALAVCPTMSLLGAKRPQHGVWQFIVATLAVVLALPAAIALLVRPGDLPDVHPLGRWFLLGLTAVGWMNFVGTRHALSASLVTAGQFVVVRRFLPGFTGSDSPAALVLDAAGALAVAAGGVLAAASSAGRARRGRAGRAAAANPAADDAARALIDPPFLALRETLGAAWALRIGERFDAIAAKRGWPCRLTFRGLEPCDGVAAEWRRDAGRSFRALARRFVTDDWLRRHECGAERASAAPGAAARADSWSPPAAAGTLPPR